MMAAAARGQNAAPAPAATPPNLADVNERIRLAALRLRVMHYERRLKAA
jgi:hypothetical protein